MYKQCNLTLCATLVIITVAVLAETETKKKANENSRNVTCKGKPMNMAPLMVGHKECHEKIFNKAPLNPRELDDEARKELEKQWAENEMARLMIYCIIYADK
ncbi:hypothetical protein Fcan01_08388 [Folsomia candida]|uniref:Uncharacterized protein n=1 Tax=Folsomia candida TaxID=158441 RepID=A0A226EKD5_FOLCA|nr:hypothetical protein Fcan01_08388 [Folsomia candida]